MWGEGVGRGTFPISYLSGVGGGLLADNTTISAKLSWSWDKILQKLLCQKKIQYKFRCAICYVRFVLCVLFTMCAICYVQCALCAICAMCFVAMCYVCSGSNVCAVCTVFAVCTMSAMYVVL